MESLLESYSDEIVIHSYDYEINSLVKSINPIQEFIVNAWDADADKVKIYINSESLVIEDWGTGVDNFKQFWAIGSQHKSSVKYTPKFRRKPIGWRGLGKLSFSKFGRKIFVETRTKLKAESSRPDFTHMKYEVESLSNHQSLSHIGTRITIKELTKKISESEIIHFIKENCYGLILPIAEGRKPLKIFVNGKQVKPEIPLGAVKKIEYQFGSIQYLLYPSFFSKIDLLYRGIKICEMNEHRLPAIGYVNVDWLNLINNGCKLAETEEVKLFLKQIKKLIRTKIEMKKSNISIQRKQVYH